MRGIYLNGVVVMWSKELERYFSDKSENTLKRYKSVVNEFCWFCHTTLAKATIEDVFEYYDYLRDKQGIDPRSDGNKKLSGRTIRNTIHLLTALFQQLENRRLISKNIFRQACIKLPHEQKNEKRPTEIIEFKKVAELCTAPDRKTKKGIRDRAIMAMIFGGGLRRSEVVNLKVGDVRVKNEDEVYLFLRETKSGKSESQPLPSWAAQAVIRLVEIRATEFAENEDFLCLSYWHKDDKKTQLSDCTLYKRFLNYAEKCGLKNITPHSGRATAICRLLDKKIEMRVVQKFARHSDLKTTEKYDTRKLDIPINDLTY